MMIIDLNEEANLLEEATFPEQCAKKSVRDDQNVWSTCSIKMFKFRVPPPSSKRLTAQTGLIALDQPRTEIQPISSIAW